MDLLTLQCSNKYPRKQRNMYTHLSPHDHSKKTKFLKFQTPMASLKVKIQYIYIRHIFRHIDYSLDTFVFDTFVFAAGKLTNILRHDICSRYWHLSSREITWEKSIRSCASAHTWLLSTTRDAWLHACSWHNLQLVVSNRWFRPLTPAIIGHEWPIAINPLAVLTVRPKTVRSLSSIPSTSTRRDVRFRSGHSRKKRPVPSHYCPEYSEEPAERQWDTFFQHRWYACVYVFDGARVSPGKNGFINT